MEESRGRKRKSPEPREEDGEGSGESASEASSVFRVASSSANRSTALRLRRFAERKPGRLARQLLTRMAEKVVVEGEANQSSSRMPVVAKAYVLRVVKSEHPHLG